MIPGAAVLALAAMASAPLHPAAAVPVQKERRVRMDTAQAVKVLQDATASVTARVAAARALSGVRDGAALDALVRALDVTHEDVQRAARESLAVGSGASFFARALQESAAAAERQRAARVLRHLQDAAQVHAVAACLSDPSAEVRRECAHALAVFGAEKAREALVRALEDPSPDVRYFAVLALADSPDAHVRNALRARHSAETDASVSAELDRILR